MRKVSADWQCPAAEDLLDAWMGRHEGMRPFRIDDIVAYGQACMEYGITEGIRQAQEKE